jgi:DNA-binding NarL/FixJ family response regulator
VGEVETAAGLMAELSAGDWDVVVLDIGLPDQNGLALLPALKQAHPKAAVLILSFHTESFYVRASLERGAAGYLSKESAPEELLDAVCAVSCGETYVSLALRDQV